MPPPSFPCFLSLPVSADTFWEMKTSERGSDKDDSICMSIHIQLERRHVMEDFYLVTNCRSKFSVLQGQSTEYQLDMERSNALLSPFCLSNCRVLSQQLQLSSKGAAGLLLMCADDANPLWVISASPLYMQCRLRRSSFLGTEPIDTALEYIYTEGLLLRLIK